MSFKIKVLFTILGAILAGGAVSLVLAFSLKPNNIGVVIPSSNLNLNGIKSVDSSSTSSQSSNNYNNSSVGLASNQTNSSSPVQKNELQSTVSTVESQISKNQTIPTLDSTDGIKIVLTKGTIVSSEKNNKIIVTFQVTNKQSQSFSLNKSSIKINSSIKSDFAMDYETLVVPAGQNYVTNGYITYELENSLLPFTISYTFDNGVTATATIN